MPELNDSQKLHLQTGLAHIDALLSEAVRILSAAETRTPFSKYVPDATPVQQKVAADYASKLRAATATALKAFRIDLPARNVSALWAARTNVVAARITLAELGPRHMRGYGELSTQGAADLSALVSQLMELLEQMDSYLLVGADLQERLRRLESVPLDDKLLKDLERVITEHGLVELRTTLEAIVERLESPRLEVAVFGRTNCGKSSLLNYLLKTNVLPVGVTPVTSVLLQIVYGPKPWGRVSFVDAAPQSFALGRLAEFADEHYNPSNARHVTRLVVELPAPLLKNGVAFIDTPGVGSLALAGAAQTMVYLPRCDVGVVLLDAASTLAPEDLALVDALRGAGAEVMVLITKADLLGDEDRLRTVAYVRRELAANTGAVLPVHCVSIKGSDAALCDQWLEKELAPCLRESKRRAEASVRRKLGLLYEAIVVALERRVSGRQDVTTSDDRGFIESGRMLAGALAQLDAAAVPRWVEPQNALLEAKQIVEEVAHNAAVLWRQSDDTAIDVRTLLAASVSSRARAAATADLLEIKTFRAALSKALAEASEQAGVSPADDEDLPEPAGLPVPDDPDPLLRTVLNRPALNLPGLPMLRRSARRQLEREGAQQNVSRQLLNYRQRLERWRSGMLSELRKNFSTQSNRLQAQFGDAGAVSANRLAAMQRDLQRLKGLDAKGIGGQVFQVADRAASAGQAQEVNNDERRTASNASEH